MTDNRLNGKKIEILAPAGSYESFRAAICAGADAVYAGGPRFGARAFADNFTDQELLEAIDYAHLHGRKLYLTVNTLLKEQELDGLSEYLAPLYERGLDAVIVQDIGVLSFVKKQFPEMDIHASTQMTITNIQGALFLKELGAARVVPARELSLEEVNDIVKNAGLEMECFVHGALCYCYSGQCLLSSMIGGRSGNRGQCAQPCRLPYTIDGKKEYFLSLKDICTLDMIPRLIEAGIDSFKIEGRMKKPEYVALVTSMYRKYTDLYLLNGREKFVVSDEDKEKILDIYNRGGFSEGYYEKHNGREMISLGRPNHAGVPAVKVISQKGREVTLRACTKIHKGDILELTQGKAKEDNYTLGNDVEAGAQLKLLLPKGIFYQKDTFLYRIRNQELLDTMRRLYMDGHVTEAISGSFYAAVGKPAVFTVYCNGCTVTAETKNKADAAKNQPLDKERVKKQLNKTGDTEFVFDTLDIVLDGPVFFPTQQLNELRRDALEALKDELTGVYRRDCPKKSAIGLEAQPDIQKKKLLLSEKRVPLLSVLAETKEQAKAAMECEDVSRIYLELGMEGQKDGIPHLAEVCETGRRAGKEIFLALPHIFRKEVSSYLETFYECLIKLGIDGVLIRNYESFHFLKEHGFDKKMILDHNLYVFNSFAKDFWLGMGVDGFTATAELNYDELKCLGIGRADFIAYGRLPVMVSAQCVYRTTAGCSKTPGTTVVKDRYQNAFRIRRFCRFCYTVMYHSEILYLLDQASEIEQLAPAYVRLQFTEEDREETKRILRLYREGLLEHRGADVGDNGFTRGHFKRGII